jgi:hypothetical protein
MWPEIAPTVSVRAAILLAVCLLSPARGMAQGHPDLNGVWLAKKSPKSAAPALLPSVAAALQAREKPDRSSTHCLPGGPLIGAGLYKFVQTPALLIMIFKDVIGYRQIFLDGRAHPEDADPSWMGHSIGHWEGDTLIVDTVALNDRSRLRTYPHTEKLHIVERYRRRDFRHLEVQTFIEDPETFAHPWKLDDKLDLAPDQDLVEYVCNEKNQDARPISAK